MESYNSPLEQIKPEPFIKIKGGAALQGEVSVSGAKNSVLPLLFSTLLAKGLHEFHNVPQLKDVFTAANILRSLGLEVKREGSSLQVKNPGNLGTKPQASFVTDMRASVLCLGPLLTCFQQCEMPPPGGCSIGERPIDLHLKGLRALGAKIEIQEGSILATADRGLKGTSIHFDFPTVGGTENLILAAVKAKGMTVLKNIAIEPEIFDLIEYLKSLGAKIKKTGQREMTIEGTEVLEPKKPYFVIPDRIEAGTLLLAGAITGGEISIKKCRPQHLRALLEVLESCGWKISQEQDKIQLKGTGKTQGLHIETAVYPGFPTDLQSQFIALMTQLNGLSSLKENIFERRFRYVEELKKMGAQIEIKDQRTALIKGNQILKGTEVKATDLRASAGLVLGGLVAEGETTIFRVEHLFRGYENLHLKLQSLGASISSS